MIPPKCQICGRNHWLTVDCDGKNKLPAGAAPPSSTPPRPKPPAPLEPVPGPDKIVTIKDATRLEKPPKDGGRLRRWREKNREKNNEYQKNYMRERRAKAKAEKEAENKS